MSANALQALLRFLSQDAKVPLAMAMSKVKELQAADLDTPEKLSKVKAGALTPMFPDEKVAKQIISAARRVSKKRAAGEDTAPSPKKQRKNSAFADEGGAFDDLEASLTLPTSSAEENELITSIMITNRAPLVLAFVLTLLKHTMSEQPLSARLSLAQAYVSTTSRKRAVSLGIQQVSKEEENAEKDLGEGQPVATIMGHQLKVIRRWGYEWKPDSAVTEKPDDTADEEPPEEKPAVWALDLEALRKSNRTDITVANAKVGNNSGLPIYTPQSGRAYLLKSFDSPPSTGTTSAKKLSAAAKAADRERNVGKLLRALDLLYESWAPNIGPDGLDARTWSWYVKVRPSVADGVAGWGGKNELKLADILALRRTP